jgi:hypothetical protein
MADNLNEDNNECLKNSTNNNNENNENGGRAKDLVHKCPSDPGNNIKLSRPIFQAASSQPSTSATTRKCVLTLDGYSYVIGKNTQK